jgi:hypothetical protein
MKSLPGGPSPGVLLIWRGTTWRSFGRLLGVGSTPDPRLPVVG